MISIISNLIFSAFNGTFTYLLRLFLFLFFSNVAVSVLHKSRAVTSPTVNHWSTTTLEPLWVEVSFSYSILRAKGSKTSLESFNH